MCDISISVYFLTAKMKIAVKRHTRPSERTHGGEQGYRIGPAAQSHSGQAAAGHESPAFEKRRYSLLNHQGFRRSGLK